MAHIFGPNHSQTTCLWCIIEVDKVTTTTVMILLVCCVFKMCDIHNVFRIAESYMAYTDSFNSAEYDPFEWHIRSVTNTFRDIYVPWQIPSVTYTNYVLQSCMIVYILTYFMCVHTYNVWITYKNGGRRCWSVWWRKVSPDLLATTDLFLSLT